MPSALACPASLKGVLRASAAAAALVEGFALAGVEAVALPVADGGEGTLDALSTGRGGEWHEADVEDAFGRPRRARWLVRADGTAIVEAAEAIPLDPERRDVHAASSRGLGLLLRAVGRPVRVLVALGGTATMDAGAGLLDVLDALPAPTVVACDVDATLLDAPRLFGPQKGASTKDVLALESRFRGAGLERVADLPGSGAAGGLGAALASLGAALVPGASLVLDELGFEPAGYDVVVTGEGTVDATTARGKAPGEVARRCAAAAVRCVVFGGRVVEPLPNAETVALSGDPARARDDLRALGARLARDLG
ncbi:MAG TPA: glycerate kinase [Gaiellaceae bacterium]|nr:glycerate kinase [Gaiellaceae bacterium]